MRCKWAVVLAVLVVGGAASTSASDDPFEAFLAAKRAMAERRACPAPSITEPAAATPPAAEQALGTGRTAPSVPFVDDVLSAAPAMSVASGPPAFRVLGVVGARGAMEALVDYRELGRPRLAPGDTVAGWKVVKITLTEVELRSKTSERAVVAVGAATGPSR